MKQQLKSSLIIFALLTFITGVAYPIAVTLIAQGLFAHQANGSVIEVGGKRVGSELIGQSFDVPGYFSGRPSATGPFADNAAASTGSNLGPTNDVLLDAVKGRVESIRKANLDQSGAVPVDLVTASASGLDPEISPAAADYQVSRVANARGMSIEKVRQLVAEHTHGRTLGILGEPRVNVLRLNLALDALPSPSEPKS